MPVYKERTASASLLLSGIGGFLVSKFVKQTKIDSRLADQPSLHQIALIETEPEERAGGTRVLGEANAAVRQEQSRLDPADRVVDQRIADGDVMNLPDRSRLANLEMSPFRFREIHGRITGRIKICEPNLFAVGPVWGLVGRKPGPIRATDPTNHGFAFNSNSFGSDSHPTEAPAGRKSLQAR